MKKTLSILIIGILLLLNAGTFSAVSLSEKSIEETGNTITITGKILTLIDGTTLFRPYFDETVLEPGQEAGGSAIGQQWPDSYDKSTGDFVYTLHSEVGQNYKVKIQVHHLGFESTEKSFVVTANTLELNNEDLGIIYLDHIRGGGKSFVTPLFNDFLVRFLGNHPILNALLGL
jgi:hypothetical protein